MNLGVDADWVADRKKPGVYLELHSKGRVWKAVLWERELPRDVKPLWDFEWRLIGSQALVRPPSVQPPRRRPFQH